MVQCVVVCCIDVLYRVVLCYCGICVLVWVSLWCVVVCCVVLCYVVVCRDVCVMLHCDVLHHGV